MTEHRKPLTVRPIRIAPGVRDAVTRTYTHSYRPLAPRHAVWRTDQTSEVMLAQWGQRDV
jgi:hypothetical protein